MGSRYEHLVIAMPQVGSQPPQAGRRRFGSHIKDQGMPICIGSNDILICSQDILYVVLVAQGRVITLVRPKKHSIHPSGKDIAIL